MAIFKSKTVSVAAPATAVFDKLSDLSSLKTLMSEIPASAVPEDQRSMLESVKVTDDTIAFPAGPVGELTMRMTQKVRPTLIRLDGEGAPVALNMSLEIGEVSQDASEAAVSIDIAIPAMLKPMIGGTLQKMADQFADVIAQLNYNA